MQDEAAIQLGLPPSHDWDRSLSNGTGVDRSEDRYPLLNQGLEVFERFPRWMGSRDADTAEALKQSIIDTSPTRDRGLASGDIRGNRPSTPQDGRSMRQFTLDQREYEIEQLLDRGVAEDGSILFRVRWKGYGPQDDTWEPEEDLLREMVQAAKLQINLAH